MKHKSLKIFVTMVLIILLIITLPGCIDQNNSESILVTAPLTTLVFKTNELPEYVIQFIEIYNDTEQYEPWPNVTAICTEKYTVDYRFNDTNKSHFLLLELRKIESIEATENSFKAQESVALDTNLEIIPSETIGDESVLGKVDTMYHIFFRKYNIIAVLTTAYDVGLETKEITDFAKIILNNIESSVKS